MKYDINWVRETLIPSMKEYRFDYKYFEQGDFGSLSQFNFESSKFGGNIDFWGLGWLGILIWDFQKEEEVINVLLESHEESEINKAWERLIATLI
jgi:hypothetical protein